MIKGFVILLLNIVECINDKLGAQQLFGQCVSITVGLFSHLIPVKLVVGGDAQITII